jgi:AraC-like DNA-binding protein
MNFEFNYRASDSPFVEHIWSTRSTGGGSFISAAATTWEIVITRERDKTTFTVRGPETKASPADTPEDAEFFGIVFKLGTFMPHLPPGNLLDTGIHLPEASSKSFWMHGSAWQFPTFENADTFLARLMRQGMLEHDPVVSAVLQGRPAHLSPRALQYRFLRATGLTQKSIQQIERAKQAAALLAKGIPILDAAYETGYFDQSHLTRSLKRLTGQTPAQILRLGQLG